MAIPIGDAPILTRQMCARLGDNLNGASVIEVPDWVQNPLGRFYLYFAHHKGRFIRLAFADAPQGPWQVHSPGVLDVTETPFVHQDLDEADEASEWVRLTGGDFLYAHVASPDVHVDHDAQTIRMYYHGLMADGSQVTRLTASADGLTFRGHSDPLATPYLRAFKHGGYIYGIAWGGALFRANDWLGPFQQGPNLLAAPPFADDSHKIRHVAVVVKGDSLHLYFTRIGDAPEAILRAEIYLSQDWNRWTVGPIKEVLRPTKKWEGAHLPIAKSRIGTAALQENALRDPFVFKGYLFYSGSGEAAIGVARLTD